MKDLFQYIPGFRTNKIVKKIVASIFYVVVLIFHLVILIGLSGTFDDRLETARVYLIFLLLVFIPFVLLSNLSGIRSRLPLFKSKRIGLKVAAWALSLFVIFIGLGTASSKLESFHTSQYRAAQILEDKKKQEQALAEKENAAKQKQAAEASKKLEETKKAEAAKQEEQKVQATETVAEPVAEQAQPTAQVEPEQPKETKEDKQEAEAVVPSGAKEVIADPKGFAFKSERKKASVEKVKDLIKDEMIYLTTKKGFYGFGSPYLKRTLTPGGIIYFGGLKDNLPDGLGLLLESSYSDMGKKTFVPRYIGYFKGGKFHGYGRLYADAADYYRANYSNLSFIELEKLGVTYLEYEGYFSGNKFDGDGNYYRIEDDTPTEEDPPVLKAYINQYAAELKAIGDQWSAEDQPLVVSILSPIQSELRATGMFESGELNGEAKSYYHGQLVYEGEYKNNEYSGKGKLYFGSGKLQYEGEFKRDQYHGKGTLYKEDGNVVYEGAWAKGDVK